jgi:hypothetical protein
MHAIANLFFPKRTTSGTMAQGIEDHRASRWTAEARPLVRRCQKIQTAIPYDH